MNLMDLSHPLVRVEHLHHEDVLLDIKEPLLNLLQALPLHLSGRGVPRQISSAMESLVLHHSSQLDQLRDLVLEILVVKRFEKLFLAVWGGCILLEVRDWEAAALRHCARVDN